MTERETKLRNLLVEQGIFSAREKLAVNVVEHKNEIQRRSDAVTRRFFVAKDDVPLYAVKYYPAAWKFPPKTIIETMKRYQRLESVKVPGLVATFESGDGVYIVEEFLREAVTLEALIRDGSVAVNEGVGLLRSIFTELYEAGGRPSGEKIRVEKDTYLEALRAFIRPGAFGDTMLAHVEKVINEHATEYRTILSTGDIIDRNLVYAHGSWHLVDFEYSHETIFGFTDAYRNILYTSWARYFSLGELYPPLGSFPVDVAAMLALAWEYHFQGNTLDPDALAQTRRHLRYIFWSAVEPSALYSLDRRVGEVEALIAQRDAEIGKVRQEALEHAGRASESAQAARNLESLVAQKDDELAILREHPKKIIALDQAIAQQRENITLLHSQLLTQQQLLLERDRQVALLTEEVKTRDGRVATLSADLTSQKQEGVKKDERIQSLTAEVKTVTEGLQAGDRLAQSLRSTLEERLVQIHRLDSDVAGLRDALSRAQQESASRQARITELTNWSDDLKHEIRVNSDKVMAQKARLDEISSRLRSTEEQLSEKTRQYQQKSADYIYIKSTLSYSIGRILTLPLVLLFELFLLVYKALDKALGRVLWPQGSKRYLLVNALVNVRQTIATATYLLRIHGFSGLWNGIKQTWESGASLGIYRNLEAPILATPMAPPSAVQLLQVRERQLSTGTGVSIVIPTLNEATNLIKLLPTLISQKGFTNIEVIVVDSGSTDDTVELSKEYGARVIAIPSEKFTHSGSRNLGAGSATQPFLLMLTADALPPSNTWLFEMYEALQRHGVAAVSCKELPRGDADLFSRVQQWNHYKHYLNVSEDDKVLSLPDSQEPDVMRRHAQLSDVACLMPLTTYQQYKFRYDYGEDLDLGLRLIKDGKKIALLGSTAIIHSHTRPPYYHLKRGYMDKLMISKILGEPLESSKMPLNSILRDILLGFSIVSSLDVPEVLAGRPATTVGGLRDAYFRNINKSSGRTSPEDIRLADHRTDDAQFLNFLKRIQKMYKKDRSWQSEENVLLRTMSHFDELTFKYMKESYEVIDETIVRDFLDSNMKSFANLCGVFLAIAVAAQTDGDPRLKDLSAELGDGKILWKSKTQSA